MGFFDKLKGPVFIKESSCAENQIEELKKLAESSDGELKEKINTEIRNIKSGLIGEEQIAYELKNSHIPMYILRDLYLEHNGLTAQIDFLVITKSRNFVIECKNMFGNIEITPKDDFIRAISYNGKSYKERIYSPITQNQRHLELIKEIRWETKTNILQRKWFEDAFAENYRSLIVLANTKSILNDKYAKKEIKKKVVSVDNLLMEMKRIMSEKSAVEGNEKIMLSLAKFFLSIHKEQPDYNKKYRELLLSKGDELVVREEEEVYRKSEEKSENEIICPRCKAPMILRTAQKGEKAGTKFYGCSRFPKCRGVVNLKV